MLSYCIRNCVTLFIDVHFPCNSRMYTNLPPTHCTVQLVGGKFVLLYIEVIFFLVIVVIRNEDGWSINGMILLSGNDSTCETHLSQ